jgi:hypothetical protein
MENITEQKFCIEIPESYAGLIIKTLLEVQNPFFVPKDCVIVANYITESIVKSKQQAQQEELEKTV